MIVDAPNTAYALQLYEMLAPEGPEQGRLRGEGRSAATFRRLEAIRKDKTYRGRDLNPPFSIRAEKAGLKILGSAVKAIGAVSGDRAAS